MQRVTLFSALLGSLLSLFACGGTSCSPQTVYIPGGGSYLYECPGTGYQDGSAFGREINRTGSGGNMTAYWHGAPYDASVSEMSASCLRYHDDWERGLMSEVVNWTGGPGGSTTPPMFSCTREMTLDATISADRFSYQYVIRPCGTASVDIYLLRRDGTLDHYVEDGKLLREPATLSGSGSRPISGTNPINMICLSVNDGPACCASNGHRECH